MDPGYGFTKRTAPVAAGAALALATVALFWPALGNGFVDLYDDHLYVLGNEAVRGGLSLRGLGWALGSLAAHNWHPLTWLSHMADVSLFGLDPRGHHLVSVLLHAANVGLVFALARACGLAPAAAALAAAAFGFHPLRVESVAWVAERKDVLSGFFGLAATLAWLRWARAPRFGRYLAALFLFALGLLSKPTMVALPAGLLLLDVWPLRRLGEGGPGLRALLVEKVPFLAAAAAVAAVTLVAQGRSGAVQGADAFPLADRLANAAVTPFLYLGKTAWPAGLAFFYPHRGAEIPAALAIAAGAALAALSAAAWWARRRHPCLTFGWGWFLATLLPVIGLVQAGRQGMADRYTYLPSVGLLLAVACTLTEIVRSLRRPAAARAAAALAAGTLLAPAVATRGQIAVWRDAGTLFRHAAAATGRNAVAANGLGALAARAGRLAEAGGLYEQAVEYDPGFGVARVNLAALLLATGRPAEAAPHAEAAARLLPADPQARYVHGTSLALAGRLDEAARELEAALALRPGYASARMALDQIRALLGPGPR